MSMMDMMMGIGLATSGIPTTTTASATTLMMMTDAETARNNN
ncbi:hypothetical protein [Bifidobacterium canis]|mgnify:CR=1 FL=1|uniref:Uncharacterized protein n=1 Tax=Bifidobacterium canis TaxID=2610880 RepID=A0A7K1J497_9BIFI|nr:hypothetical protein [Bifidobacterium canis]MUH59275.1 hypothetical protein [Bifidobacterium canis]